MRNELITQRMKVMRVGMAEWHVLSICQFNKGRAARSVAVYEEFPFVQIHMTLIPAIHINLTLLVMPRMTTCWIMPRNNLLSDYYCRE